MRRYVSSGQLELAGHTGFEKAFEREWSPCREFLIFLSCLTMRQARTYPAIVHIDSALKARVYCVANE